VIRIDTLVGLGVMWNGERWRNAQGWGRLMDNRAHETLPGWDLGG
jgi:hypothetical protein